jgi:hypothetical protein
MDRIDRLRATYAAFNARDIDAVLAQMSADVDWPNAVANGVVAVDAAGRRGVSGRLADSEPQPASSTLAA